MSWQIAAVAAYVVALAAAQLNLVANPSFEDGSGPDGVPSCWSTRDGVAVKLCTDGGHTGGSYVRFLDSDATASQFLESERIPARPGGAYAAAAWLRTAAKCDPGVYLNFYDQFGTRIQHKYERASGPTNGWTRVEVADTAPEQVWTVSAAVYTYISDTGEFDADDVEMTVQGGKTPGAAGVERARCGDKETVEIGGRLELFVDSFLMDGASGEVERRLHHPVPREIVLQLNQPWEGETCTCFVAFRDGDRIRMYYRGSTEGRQFCCLAESEDGVYFHDADLYSFQFSKTD